MRTLNEQIQRLRNVLVTCYRAIKDKGGTIPEAGERNMTNLPAAVRSIPQSHTKLVDLEVTANREYLPATYDADGFSKVTAKFDTSSLPKVKVSTFAVTNDCIVNGYWAGELLDTSFMSSFNSLFKDCSELQQIDVSGWNTNSVRDFRDLFHGCLNLQHLNVSNWNTTNLTSLNGCMRNCKQIRQLDVSKWDVSNVDALYDTFQNLENLQQLDLSNWDVSNVNNVSGFLYGCRALNSLIGGRLIDDVIVNNLAVLKGLKVSLSIVTLLTIDTASILALVNGLADLTGQTTQTLTLGSTIGARLDTEQIAGVLAKEYLASIAEEKNWTIAY